jgi:Replication-relaxation
MVQSQFMSVRDRPRVELRPRDYELLTGLLDSRVMTLAHVACLYFDGKTEMAKKRVQKLKAAGYLRERPRLVSSPSVLFLSRKALGKLQEEGRLAGYPPLALSDLDRRAQVSETKLKHELEVMDVKAAFIRAIRAMQQLRATEFSTWPALNQFKACRPSGEQVTMYPDGFLRVEEKEADGGLSEHSFFLEVDRSHESLTVVAEKCHCYGDYYRSGGFACRNGASADAYCEYPFRVLVVCKSEQRRNNIGERLLANNPPIRHQACLTTFAEAIRNPLAVIWTTPADYLNFEASTDDGRQTRRTSLISYHVAVGIEKHSLPEGSGGS